MVALAIATVKAALVAVFFMHLWEEKGVARLVLLVSAVLVALLIGLTLIDNMTRFPYTNPPVLRVVDGRALPEGRAAHAGGARAGAVAPAATPGAPGRRTSRSRSRPGSPAAMRCVGGEVGAREAAQHDPLQRRVAREPGPDLGDRDAGGPLEREAEDPGGDGRERDRPGPGLARPGRWTAGSRPPAPRPPRRRRLATPARPRGRPSARAAGARR